MKILIGFDGSNVARDAFKLVPKPTLAFGAKIEIVRTLAQNHNLRPVLSIK